MLSTKDLKWQMKGKRTEKLTEQFMGPYKVKRVCYKSPKKEMISHAFKYLIQNLKSYNKVKV